MPKSLSGDLRERVIEAVQAGASRREAAERFEISASAADAPQIDSRRWRHERGSADPLARSPKSLSKVSRMRSSRAAHASTSGSVVPRAAILIQTMSCPAAKSSDRHAREILVGEEAHFTLRSGISSPSSTYRAHMQGMR